MAVWRGSNGTSHGSEASYEVNWSAIDDLLDLGGSIHWVDSPAHKWKGLKGEADLYEGKAECPVCEGARSARELCDYCLRGGAQVALPRLYPRQLPVKPSTAKFQARVKAAKQKRVKPQAAAPEPFAATAAEVGDWERRAWGESRPAVA